MSGRPAACRFRKPTLALKRNIVHAHDACVRAAILWLAFVHQLVLRQHAARHAAMQARASTTKRK